MLDLTWIQPVISAVESLLTIVSNPPFSYFIALALISGVVVVIRKMIRG